MIECKAMLFAEWATQSTPDMKMIVANTFNSIVGTAPPGVTLPAEGLEIRAQSLFLVYILEGSIADNTDHIARLTIEHEDGEKVIDPINIPIKFIINPKGRPMRFQGIVSMTGLPLHAPGDYTVKLYIDDRFLAEANLYVELRQA